MTPTSSGPHVVLVHDRDEIAAVIASWSPTAGPPVVVLVGGASGMDAKQEAATTALFRSHLVPALQRWGATVVDGGTDAGIMRLIGAERSAAGADFALVGVAAVGTVAHTMAHEPRGDTDLEPHHPLVVLVPGSEWGDEGPWLADVASAVAAGGSSATLLVNGGEIAYDDTRHSLAADRPVLVVAGSGRTADDLAAAVAGDQASERAQALVRSGRVTSAAAGDPDALIGQLGRLLGREG